MLCNQTEWTNIIVNGLYMLFTRYNTLMLLLLLLVQRLRNVIAALTIMMMITMMMIAFFAFVYRNRHRFVGDG